MGIVCPATMCVRFSFPPLLGESPVPEIYLAFAFSATGVDAVTTFRLIKDTIKYIVNKYGTDKIHYGLLAFGRVFHPFRDFRREAFYKEHLIMLLETMPGRFTGLMFTLLGGYVQ